MTFFPLEFSVVVAGQDCNPTILNPDFLERRGIVPVEWGWKLDGPPLTTPAFATVSYDSGVIVTVDPNRFIVSDRRVAGDGAASRAVEIARAYIQVLPHVRYTAVGHNFRTLAEVPEAEHYLQQRFLADGAWDEELGPMQAISLTLGYSLAGGRLNLTFEAAVVTVPSEGVMDQKKGVLVSGNYHRDCAQYPSADEVLGHLGHAQEDALHFQRALERMITAPSGKAEGV
jgi:hypothetical protein